MQAVRSVKNQYLGVNAHLHSYWQSSGGWSDFHTRHIVHLADTLKPLLLPMGYTAAVEPSLQIRRLDEREDPEAPESDVTIYDLQKGRRPRTPTPIPVGGSGFVTSVGEVVLSLPAALLENQKSGRPYRAVKIYAIKPGKPDRGDPVAWIELLSPSNKPSGRDSQEYQNKRLKIIENGIVFVEIDYLHESAPTLRGFPSYHPRRNQPREKDAHPYRLLVIDPRPNLMQGVVRVSEFDVDQPIPPLTIALNGGDTLTIDFGAAYRKTFEEAMFGLELVDYRQLPAHFDRYSPEDQTRIAARMVTVIEAAQRGADLETGPLPAQAISLAEALTRLKQPAEPEKSN